MQAPSRHPQCTQDPPEFTLDAAGHQQLFRQGQQHLLIALSLVAGLWVGLSQTVSAAKPLTPQPHQALNNDTAHQATQQTASRPLLEPGEWQALAQRRQVIRDEIRQLLQLTADPADKNKQKNNPNQPATNTPTPPQPYVPDATVLTRLQTLAANSARPRLERDAVIYGYAMGLRQLQPHQVDPPLVQWLESYRSNTWRLHEESASYRVPVFNVNAAIMGTRNEWSMHAGADTARQLAADNAQQAVTRYIRGDTPFRHGFEQQLNHLSSQQLQRLQHALSARPEWQPLALTGQVTALLEATRGDALPAEPTSFAAWLQQAPGPAAVHVLRSNVAHLPRAQRLTYYQQALKHPDEQVFGVALALAAANWSTDSNTPQLDDAQLQQWQTTLYGLLSDRRRGAAAAMHLARLAAPSTLRQWQQQAAAPLVRQRLLLIQRLQSSQQQTGRAHAGDAS